MSRRFYFTNFCGQHCGTRERHCSTCHQIQREKQQPH